jgi:peptidoglycan/LPS O-acetylase OafA/YrhL
MKPGASYRADVDGLRAVAVLSVLLFHLHVHGFGGGYVGVDVFFVISGYLITGLIQAELGRGTFSLRAFYLRRVRRLAPALLVVSVPVTATAFLVLYPEDMRSFASSIALQFVSLQNVFFLTDGEYFRNSDTKLLLHTWTLAVEEQFYLLWPLFLLVSRRVGFRKRLVLIAGIMVGSFLLNLALMTISPKASFFLLPSRAWELGMGGVVALLEERKLFETWLTPRRRAVSGVAGLAAILTSVVVFTADTPFPGRAALLPVIGAVLVVVSGIGGTSPVGRALADRRVVHLGLISYPLYLWHWPLIALLHHLHRDPTRPFYAVLVLAGSIGLAELTYRIVELPIRNRRWLPTTKPLLAVTGTAALTLSFIGVHSYVTDGAAYRFTPAARAFLTAPLAASGQRCGFVFRVLHPKAPVCALHEEPAPSRRVLLWGNSHADMWSELVVELGATHKASVYLNARNCRAIADNDFCGRPVQSAVLAFIASEHVTDVVLASSWYGVYETRDDVFERDLAEIVGTLAAQGVRTWLVIDTPQGKPFDPIVAFEKNPRAPRFGAIPRAEYEEKRLKEQAFFTTLSGANTGTAIIDPSGALCAGDECVAGKGDEVWYRDTNHLTHSGTRTAKPQFTAVFGGERAGGN